jgi:hypothetical protein
MEHEKNHNTPAFSDENPFSDVPPGNSADDDNSLYEGEDFVKVFPAGPGGNPDGAPNPGDGPLRMGWAMFPLIPKARTKKPKGRPSSQVKRDLGNHSKRVEIERRQMDRLLKRPSQFMQDFVSVLTDIEWQVAVLHFGNTWPVAQIARVMERDRKTISETIHRAKRKMQQHAQNAKTLRNKSAE